MVTSEYSLIFVYRIAFISFGITYLVGVPLVTSFSFGGISKNLRVLNGMKFQVVFLSVRVLAKRNDLNAAFSFRTEALIYESFLWPHGFPCIVRGALIRLSQPIPRSGCTRNAQ